MSARTGRPPKSTEQHQAEGTLRGDRHATTPLIAGDRRDPEPGPYLTEDQAVHFRRIVAELSGSRLLDSADRGMIELAAIELDVLERCNRHLKRGLMVNRKHGGYNGGPTHTTKELSPYYRAREEAIGKLRYLYGELGIGPLSRAALANRGIKGKGPARALAGVGEKPTPLRVVNGSGGE
jgi:phage terminase small subunit